MLACACQQFMGKAEDEIRQISTETLEGHQRAIMGNMTVEVLLLSSQTHTLGGDTPRPPYRPIPPFYPVPGICVVLFSIIYHIMSTPLLQVKIQGQNEEMLKAACQQFLGKRENDIRVIAQETLEGHQRAIMGNMTVEVWFEFCFIYLYTCLCFSSSSLVPIK